MTPEDVFHAPWQWRGAIGLLLGSGAVTGLAVIIAWITMVRTLVAFRGRRFPVSLRELATGAWPSTLEERDRPLVQRFRWRFTQAAMCLLGATGMLLTALGLLRWGAVAAEENSVQELQRRLQEEVQALSPDGGVPNGGVIGPGDFDNPHSLKRAAPPAPGEPPRQQGR